MAEPLVKVKRLSPQAQLPRRATPGSSGFDLFACLGEGNSMVLSTQPKLIGTGIAVEVPPGYDVQIRPRSGLSLKGVGVTLGTIDSDYRGEVKVTMYMFDPTRTPYEVQHGDRVAQMVISILARLDIEEVQELRHSGRGAGGHGSTGR